MTVTVGELEKAVIFCGHTQIVLRQEARHGD